MKKSFFCFCVFVLILCGCGETVSYELVGSISHEEVKSDYVIDEKEGEERELYVSILGEVIEPGVYIVSEGCRMFEAINLAGGITENADISGINLVDFIEDGMQILIPSKNNENYVNQESAVILTNHDGMININKADADALKTIPGIGDTRAAAIIDYREKHGAFSTVEEIMNVSGIKENTFSSIRDYIYVD